jgi:hypothetical protein
MIHLIGVNHLVQYDHDHPATAKFKADVLEVIDAAQKSLKDLDRDMHAASIGRRFRIFSFLSAARFGTIRS